MRGFRFFLAKLPILAPWTQKVASIRSYCESSAAGIKTKERFLLDRICGYRRNASVDEGVEDTADIHLCLAESLTPVTYLASSLTDQAFD